MIKKILAKFGYVKKEEQFKVLSDDVIQELSSIVRGLDITPSDIFPLDDLVANVAIEANNSQIQYGIIVPRRMSPETVFTQHDLKEACAAFALQELVDPEAARDIVSHAKQAQMSPWASIEVTDLTSAERITIKCDWNGPFINRIRALGFLDENDEVAAMSFFSLLIPSHQEFSYLEDDSQLQFVNEGKVFK